MKLSIIVIFFVIHPVILTAGTSDKGKPNIIYILADDWGIGDVKVYGGDRCKIETPNMDKLAEEGMRFTDAHSSSAVCTPTRYSLLTGRYCWRSTLKSGVLGGYSPPLIEQGRETVASMLKRHGYATGMVGKWHLGMGFAKSGDDTDWTGTIENGPTTLGFDYFWGISASLDMPPYIWIENDRFVGECTTTKSFGRTGEAHTDFEAVDVLPTLTQKAVTFIAEKANAGENFFLYMPLNSPHTPHVPSPEFQGKSSLGTYGDFVMETDWSIGEVVKAIEDAGMADNTIIIVTSDNGTSPWKLLGNSSYDDKLKFRTETSEADDPALHYPSNIYRGMKADIYEGGHRVPFIVRWDGKLQAGSVENTTIGLVDLYATCAEIVGADIPDNVAEDSQSILPILLGAEFAPLRDAEVHHSINGSFAIRQGKWKLAFCPGSGGWSNPLPPKTGPFFGYENIDPTALKDYEWVQLFDLEADPAETTNLSDQYPDKIKELTELAQKYIEDGRSTPGTKQQNDGEEVHLYQDWAQAPTSTTGGTGNNYETTALMFNDFGEEADIGAGFQSILTNFNSGSIGASPMANTVTGTISTGPNSGANIAGINNIALTDVSAGVGFSVEWKISRFSGNLADINYNGWFFGIGDNTDTGANASWNNNNTIGITLFSDKKGDMSFQEHLTVDDAFQTHLLGAEKPTKESLEDGFTISIIVLNDNNWSAHSSGLSTDFNISGRLSKIQYSDLASNIGALTTIQGKSVSYTIDHVSLSVINSVPPRVDAGEDISVNTPESEAVLNGSVMGIEDPISIQWVQTSGPASAVFSGENTLNPTVTGLTNDGIYYFELTITDSESNEFRDNVKVSVAPPYGNKDAYLYLTEIAGTRSPSSSPQNDTEWASFLEKNNIIFNSPLSEHWGKGLYIADGRTGALIRKNTGSEWGLRFEIGKTDVATDKKYRVGLLHARVPLGSIILTPGRTVTDAQLKSDIWNGEAIFSMNTEDGDISGVSFVEREYNTLVAIIDSDTPFDMNFEEEWGISKFVKNALEDPEQIVLPGDISPKPTKEEVNGISLTIQPLLVNAAHVTACKKVTEGTKTYYYLAIDKVIGTDVSDAVTKARANAIAKLEQAIAQGAETLRTKNKAWWNNYMKQAWVSIPDDPMWELWYWQQIYKFGGYSHADDVVIADLMGPWFTKTDWPACWWNLNYQLQYFPTFTANRMDVGRSLITTLDGLYDNGSLQSAVIPDAIVATKRTSGFIMGENGGLTVELGNLTWVLHNYWRYWRYSMDKEIGRNFFKLLRADMNHYMGIMTIDTDGKYNLPPNLSPEYSKDKFENTTYSISSFRWGLNTLISMNEELEMNDPLLDQWTNTLEHLIPTPIGDNGYKISEDQDFDHAHRHYSHLLDLYPYHAIHPEDGSEADDLFRKSLSHWIERPDGNIAAFSFLGASNMYATLGEGEAALEKLQNIFNPYNFDQSVTPGVLFNTFYNSGVNPTIESALASVESIDYMLLQSMRGVIRVFPAVPEKWANTSFENLRTEGAFLVSAERRDGKTQCIEIESLAGEACVLEIDMTSFTASIPYRITQINGPNGKIRYEIDLNKSEKIKLTHSIETGTGMRSINRDKNKIHVFPNPLRRGDNLTISFENSSEKADSLEVVSLDGKILFSGDSKLIKINETPPGVYLIKVKSSQGNLYSRKLIIQ